MYSVLKGHLNYFARQRPELVVVLQPGEMALVTLAPAAQPTGLPQLGEVHSVEFALVPPDNARGNFTKIVRRFTVRIRFNRRDANSALARPGMPLGAHGDTV